MWLHWQARPRCGRTPSRKRTPLPYSETLLLAICVIIGHLKMQSSLTRPMRSSKQLALRPSSAISPYRIRRRISLMGLRVSMAMAEIERFMLRLMFLSFAATAARPLLELQVPLIRSVSNTQHADARCTSLLDHIISTMHSAIVLSLLHRSHTKGIFL